MHNSIRRRERNTSERMKLQHTHQNAHIPHRQRRLAQTSAPTASIHTRPATQQTHLCRNEHEKNLCACKRHQKQFTSPQSPRVFSAPPDEPRGRTAERMRTATATPRLSSTLPAQTPTHRAATGSATRHTKRLAQTSVPTPLPAHAQPHSQRIYAYTSKKGPGACAEDKRYRADCTQATPKPHASSAFIGKTRAGTAGARRK